MVLPECGPGEVKADHCDADTHVHKVTLTGLRERLERERCQSLPRLL